MNEEQERINRQRAYWQNKMRIQLDHMMFASLDGDEQLHKDILEDFGTSVLCLWRFDKKLRISQKDEERELLNADD